MMPVIRVDVVIVSYRSAETLEAAVAGLLPLPVVATVTVVDNASPDRSARVARDAGAAVIENAKNRGFAAAVNQGWRFGQAEHVLLLNPDAVLGSDALDGLIRALDADPTLAIVGPLLVNDDGLVTAGARRFSTIANRSLAYAPLIHRCRAWSPDYPVPPLSGGGVLPVDYVWGAALLTRRSFLSSVGGLDERFFMYEEDEDLGLRARAWGCGVGLVTDVCARHVGGVSSRGLEPLAEARKVYATRQLLEKWRGRHVANVYTFLMFCVFATQWAAGTVKRRCSDAWCAAASARGLACLLFAGSAAPSEVNRSANCGTCQVPPLD